MYVYIKIYIYTRIHIYMYMYICIHVYTYMSIDICIYIYMYVYVYRYTYICGYMYTLREASAHGGTLLLQPDPSPLACEDAAGEKQRHPLRQDDTFR